MESPSVDAAQQKLFQLWGATAQAMAHIWTPRKRESFQVETRPLLYRDDLMTQLASGGSLANLESFFCALSPEEEKSLQKVKKPATKKRKRPRRSSRRRSLEDLGRDTFVTGPGAGPGPAPASGAATATATLATIRAAREALIQQKRKDFYRLMTACILITHVPHSMYYRLHQTTMAPPPSLSSSSLSSSWSGVARSSGDGGGEGDRARRDDDDRRLDLRRGRRRSGVEGGDTREGSG
jgi:hypothetical protein